METIRSNQLIKKKKKVPVPITCPGRKHTAQRKQKVTAEVTASVCWELEGGGERHKDIGSQRKLFSVSEKILAQLWPT